MKYERALDLCDTLNQFGMRVPRFTQKVNTLINSEKFLDSVKQQPWFLHAIRCFDQVLGERDEEAEEVFVDYPNVAYWYAAEILEGDTNIAPGNGRFPTLESHTIKLGIPNGPFGGGCDVLFGSPAELPVPVVRDETFGIEGRSSGRFCNRSLDLQADPHWNEVYDDLIASGAISEHEFIGTDGY